jgi:hypothetical protein
VAGSVLLPAVIGGLATWSAGAVGAVLGQPGPDRPAAPRDLVDQLVCHVYGDRPFDSRQGDQLGRSRCSRSGGSHNLHHADPTCARHACCAARLTSMPA